MAILYLTEQGTVLSKQGERLVVSKDGKILSEIPLIKVEQVQVRGQGITVTMPALFALARRDVEVIFFTQAGTPVVGTDRRGTMRGDLLRAQVRLVDNPGRTLALARRIVAGKLANQDALLRRMQGSAPPAVARALAGVEAMAARVPGAPDLDTLRGFEGQAAAAYWSGFRALLRGSWGFEKRAFHPPPDPINALLSFGYHLLLADIRSALYSEGLDPSLGVLHAITPGRPSLALDLEEEWRPVIVDALVLGLVNRGQITPDDFERVTSSGEDEPGVYLRPEARKTFIYTYERRVSERSRYPPPRGDEQTFRHIFKLQAQAFKRAILTPELASYRPYTG